MKVLIVDDSKTILRTMSYKLEGELGLKVYTAASMKECADLILEHKGKFDIALLDYNLPDAQNGEIVTFINKFKIPSILLTGFQLDKNNEIFKNPNLIDYIIKQSSYALEYTVSMVRRFILNEKIEVMIIDDSKTFAAKMEALCKKYNLNTIVQYGAKEALETIKTRPNIKLILVDYMMPNMDGLEFTMELRKTYKKDEVALIALSGTSEKEIVSSFLKYGANDFLYKDFSNEEFLARVNNNLEVVELFTSTQDKAKKDYLTGVFNKNYLMNLGEEVYQISKKRKDLLAAVCVEIDNFEIFTESKGHETADEAIKLIAAILEKNLNKDSLISRFSVDQFCILLKNRPSAEIHQTFQEIQQIVQNTPFEYNDETHSITISVGVNNNISDSLEEMIDLADEALCSAKHKGENLIEMYYDF
ncbi:MAG: response regulator [Campylobacterota bacterium]|nr:response regulator [Campylobacterota bacterium]